MRWIHSVYSVDIVVRKLTDEPREMASHYYESER